MKLLGLFIILALIAEVLGTIGGFGSSMLFVPIANYFFDFQSVLGITALFHLSSNVSKIALFRKGFDRKLAINMGIPAVICVVAGAYLSKFIDKKSFELSLSIFLISVSGILFLFKNLKVKATTSNSISGGALSGFIAGLIGTGGAIRGITLAAFSLEKEVFIATSAVIDLAIDFSRSIVYFFNGYMHKHDLYLIPILLVVGFAGTYAGKLILKKMSERVFRGGVLILIFAIGVITLVKYFS